MYAPPATIRALWPTPALGDWAVRDLNHPVPIAGGDGLRIQQNNISDFDNDVDDPKANTGVGSPVDPSTSQGEHHHEGKSSPEQFQKPGDGFNARRSGVDRGAYAEQYYTKGVTHTMTRSLGRETVYNWADAQFNVGGIGYPLDYGYGPGFHGDATVEMGNVQMYMKPGVWRRPTVVAK